jgi:pimeloyl-ACP methyl ester carboxylesterase
LKETKEIKKKIRVNFKTKLILGAIFLLLVGIIYEHIEEYQDFNKYVPVGQLINVDGHYMHIYGQGIGEVKVVFSAGWKIPSPYVDFYPLYNEISKYTRTLVYDRPGYGWSEIADTPRDIDTIAKEMHELLMKSGEKPPYILVGHSIGSLEVLRFAQLYKNEVKGIILIDGSNPEMYINNKVKASGLIRLRTSIKNNLIFFLNKTGITRLLFQIAGFYDTTSLATARNNLKQAPESFKKIDQAMFLRTFNNKNQCDEGDNKENNANTVTANGYLTDVPLRIITSEERNSYKGEAQNQVNLKKWSQNSEQIIVKESGHAIHWVHPEVINNEILNLIL